MILRKIEHIAPVLLCGVFAVAVAVVGCGRARDSEAPVPLDIQTGKGKATSLLVADWDLQDGREEDSVLTADEIDGQVFVADGQIGYDPKTEPRIAGLADIDGDGRKELAVARLESDVKAWLSFVRMGQESYPTDHEDWRLELPEWTNHGKDFRSGLPWECMIDVLGQADFDGDGVEDLVLVVNTTWELIPRGIWIIRVERGERGAGISFKTLDWWAMRTSPGLVTSILTDLDGDDLPEIVVQGTGYDNWTDKEVPKDFLEYRDRPSDDRGQVIVLSYDRQARKLAPKYPGLEQGWRSERRGGVWPYAGPFLEDRGQILYLFRHGPDSTPTLEAIDGRTGSRIGDPRSLPEARRVLAHFHPDGPSNHAGFQGLVVTYEDGRMDLLDDRLRQLKTARLLDGVALVPLLIGDLDGDGSEELVTASGSRMRIISLPYLQILVSHLLDARSWSASLRRRAGPTSDSWRPPQIILSTLTDDQRRERLGRNGDLRVSYCQVVRRLRETTIDYSGYLIGFSVGLVAGAIGAWCALLRRLRRRARDLTARNRDALLEVLASVGHAKMTGSTLSQIRMLIEHLQRMPEPPEPLVERLEELTKSFRQIVWPQLERIPPAARRAGISGRLVEDHCHCLETLGRHLGDGREILPEELVEEADEIFAAIVGLSSIRHRMLQELRRYYRCDPVAVVEGMLEAAGPEAKRRQVAVGLTASRLEPMVGAFIDEAHLRVILEDLFANALRALDVCAEKKLSVVIDTTGERVIIDIKDSGPGIPEEIKTRVFERGFTTRKTGGGLGLHQASELLDRYGGRIMLARSEPGWATIMRIELQPV